MIKYIVCTYEILKDLMKLLYVIFKRSWLRNVLSLKDHHLWTYQQYQGWAVKTSIQEHIGHQFEESEVSWSMREMTIDNDEKQPGPSGTVHGGLRWFNTLRKLA